MNTLGERREYVLILCWLQEVDQLRVNLFWDNENA